MQFISKLAPWPVSRVPIHMSLLYKWLALTSQNSVYGYPTLQNFLPKVSRTVFSEA